MNLYTEKQVIDFTMSMISQYEFGNKNIWNKELLKESLNNKTQITLPSDEEIYNLFQTKLNNMTKYEYLFAARLMLVFVILFIALIIALWLSNTTTYNEYLTHNDMTMLFLPMLSWVLSYLLCWLIAERKLLTK